MKSLEIFQQFEEAAVAWGKQNQKFHVGDLVIWSTGKLKRKCKISRVEVVVGRNAQQTTRKTFDVLYVGRRMKKDGTFIDGVGCGVLLDEFETESGQKFSRIAESGVNDWVSDCGLTFDIEVEPEAVKKYPNAYATYKDCVYPYGK